MLLVHRRVAVRQQKAAIKLPVHRDKDDDVRAVAEPDRQRDAEVVARGVRRQGSLLGRSSQQKKRRQPAGGAEGDPKRRAVDDDRFQRLHAAQKCGEPRELPASAENPPDPSQRSPAGRRFGQRNTAAPTDPPGAGQPPCDEEQADERHHGPEVDLRFEVDISLAVFERASGRLPSDSTVRFHKPEDIKLLADLDESRIGLHAGCTKEGAESDADDRHQQPRRVAAAPRAPPLVPIPLPFAAGRHNLSVSVACESEYGSE